MYTGAPCSTNLASPFTTLPLSQVAQHVTQRGSHPSLASPNTVFVIFVSIILNLAVFHWWGAALHSVEDATK